MDERDRPDLHHSQGVLVAEVLTLAEEDRRARIAAGDLGQLVAVSAEPALQKLREAASKIDEASRAAAEVGPASAAHDVAAAQRLLGEASLELTLWALRKPRTV